MKESTYCKIEAGDLFLFSIIHSDVRYKRTKDLIEAKSIVEFSQLFDLVPKSTLARILRKNTNRMDDLIAQPQKLRYEEIKKVSELLDISCSAIIRLIDKDFV